MITIKLGNFDSKEQVEKIKNKLNGESYYNFEVSHGIYMSNYPVYVSTSYEGAKENEVKDMLLYVMATKL